MAVSLNRSDLILRPPPFILLMIIILFKADCRSWMTWILNGFSGQIKTNIYFLIMVKYYRKILSISITSKIRSETDASILGLCAMACIGRKGYLINGGRGRLEQRNTSFTFKHTLVHQYYSLSHYFN